MAVGALDFREVARRKAALVAALLLQISLNPAAPGTEAARPPASAGPAPGAKPEKPGPEFRIIVNTNSPRTDPEGSTPATRVTVDTNAPPAGQEQLKREIHAIVQTNAPSAGSEIQVIVGTNAPRSGPEGLQHDLRVVVQTNAPPAGRDAAKGTKQQRIDASWRGWDGLHLELNQRIIQPKGTNFFSEYLAGSNDARPIAIHFEQVKMTANLGVRLEVDGAAFLTSESLTGFDDSIEIRRAFFEVGGDCILVMPVSYFIQLGYIPQQFYINKAYLRLPNVKYLGNLQFGVFTPPMGLSLVTSSRDLTFMEPAACLQAIGPPTLAGLQIGHPVFNQRATWTLGLFGDANGSADYGNASSDYGSAIGRLTWLAIDHQDASHPAANRYLHLGLSANYQYSATSSLRYQSRPESDIAPYVIDTGNINAAGAAAVAAEAAWVNGPFSAQGEFIHSFVKANNAGTLHFYGCYAQASWYLTGESRPYNPNTGAFQRLTPRHSFNFGKGGAWGALEVAGRISYTDLSDGRISGGRLREFTAGLNWYFNAHVRWMFNYGLGHVSGGPQNGTMNIFQTRLGVDF